MDNGKDQPINSKIALVFDHDGTLVNTQGRVPALYPEISELLGYLAKKNTDLYMWSLRPRSSLIRITKELGIYSYFRDVRASDDGNFPKPHPEGLKDLLDGYDLNYVCHIGDGAGDFNGASQLGVPFIAACWNDPAYGKQWTELQTQYPRMGVAYKPSEILGQLELLGIRI